jgi:hypothetical protein
VNGLTRIYRRVITEVDQKPFLKLYLPEQNVLGIVSVIHKDGTTFGANPTSSEFDSTTNKWYEVKSLIEGKVFIPDPTTVSDRDNFKAGKYIDVSNKFVTEYTPEGYFSLTFGSGTINPMDNLQSFVDNGLTVSLGSFLNNMSLGSTPRPNTTIFVKYRIGGGRDSNLGVNVITSVDSVDFVVEGPSASINSQVIQSLSVSNVTPAVGGADQPTIEEVRNMVAYNFSAQNRAVTLNDYKSLIETMPSTFGAPAKVNVLEEDNKVKIKLLSYDADSNLTDTVSTTLKNNIMTYLSEYRMLNDFIEISSGEVIDFRLEIDLVVDKNVNRTEVIKNSINETVDYFSIERRKMGDPLFVGDIYRILGNVNGVVNVIDIRVFNQIGGLYSSSEVAQAYKDNITKEILQSDMTIYMLANQIYQIRFPNKDIKIRIKTLGTTTF